MTVAAVILPESVDEALAPTFGQPRIRRLADLAWAGGALPIVVVSADPDGAVAKALTGSEASHAAPPGGTPDVLDALRAGLDLAMAEVHDLSGALVWPARMAWVGPETITSMIETHGTDPGTLLRPAWHGDPGWPVLVPSAGARALGGMTPGGTLEGVLAALAAGLPTRLVEVGDPGVVHDAATALDTLPAYEGPPDPPGGHRHEWGEDVESEAGLAGP